jgi:hypothetical protein
MGAAVPVACFLKAGGDNFVGTDAVVEEAVAGRPDGTTDDRDADEVDLVEALAAARLRAPCSNCSRRHDKVCTSARNSMTSCVIVPAALSADAAAVCV